MLILKKIHCMVRSKDDREQSSNLRRYSLSILQDYGGVKLRLLWPLQLLPNVCTWGRVKFVVPNETSDETYHEV